MLTLPSLIHSCNSKKETDAKLQGVGHDEKKPFYARLDDLKKVRLDYSAKYKELIRLRQMTHNAKSEPYLYGQALSKTHPAPENSPTPAKEKVPDKAPPQKNLQLHISKDISPDGEIPL